jgi:eukaryotic-like serine/threonine-protein kinase
MSLSSGYRLGPYEIEAPIGAGGMGEVYRARDTRLRREVAVKVLPGSFSQDPDRLRRFEQEARAASALNHPGILTIHDFGEHEGSPYVVSELLEGEDLRQRMAGAPLSVRKALDYAAQIARGLAAAHERGIVHRDLKPENLFVTRDGRVKILDFGLAKLTEPERPGLPTSGVATRTAGTEPGVVMGTLGYMSPEQVRGQPADHRSDIFSFGAVLYEMLSGKRAFAGGSAADTMSAILREDPPELATAEPSLSPALDRIVRRCLEKDPQHRFHSAHDLGFALESVTGLSGALAKPMEVPAAAVPVAKRRPALVSAGAAALLLLALAAAAVWLAGYRLVRPEASERVIAAGATFQLLTTQSGVELFPTISPDGKTFVYVGYSSGNADLYLQRVDGRNAINLTRDTAEDDIQPAFSPDGSQIAFRSEREGGGIFLMGATGESVRRLTDAGFNPAWSPDGKEIVVADEGIQTPLSRNVKSRLWAVDVATGAKRIVTPGDAVRSSWTGDAVQPSWSPHGHRIAYWGHRPGHHRDIWTVPAAPAAGAKAGEGEVPVTDDPGVDWNPVWSPDGASLYFSSDRNGTMNLWRVAIDEKTGKVLGKPEPVTAPSRWVGHMNIAADGRRMVYASADETSIVERVPFDPAGGRVTGEPAPLLAGALLVREIGISPDGKWISFSSRGTREDLFVASSDGSSLRQLTSDAFRERGADWSADGKRIVFYCDRTGRWEFWSINSDGSGLTQLTRGTVDPWSARWSPDGTRLAFPDGTNTYLLPLGRPLGTEKPEPLPRFDAAGDAFAVSSWSADGRALAGTVSRTDGSEIPGIVVYRIDSGQYRRVTEFGDDAHWLSDGRRLLVGDSSSGRISLVDAASGKPVLVFDPLRLRPGERGGSGIGVLRAKFGVSRDDRTIFLVRDHTEADIWQVELDGPPAGK